MRIFAQPVTFKASKTYLTAFADLAVIGFNSLVYDLFDMKSIVAALLLLLM